MDLRDFARAAALAALLAAGACAEGSGEAAPVTTMSLSQQGRVLAQQNCSRCHALGELGTSPRSGAPPLRDVLDSYAPNRIRQSFEEGLAIGHPDMPLFQFQPVEVDALLAYLQSIRD